MLSHSRIISSLFLFITLGASAFAAEASHAAGASGQPSSLHAPGDANPAQKKLPTSLISPKTTPATPSAHSDAPTSDSQTVTYDPRLLLPPGKTVELGKLVNNENVLILEGVEVFLQDRRSQLLTVLGMECVDASTCNRIKDHEQDIRKAIATTVARYSVQKISTLEGKMELRDELSRVMNQAIGTTGIKDVYFQTLTLVVARK